MDVIKARDHLEMVDRILSEVQPRLCTGGRVFVVWGVASAAITVVSSLVSQGRAAPTALWFVVALNSQQASYSRPSGRDSRNGHWREIRSCSASSSTFSDHARTRLYRRRCGLSNLSGDRGSSAIKRRQASLPHLHQLHGNRRAQVAGVVVVSRSSRRNSAPNIWRTC